MHPIEHLRYVARASGHDAGLVREAAGALASFADDARGRVTACRRIVERHPAAGQMWSLCARVLVAVDPVREARQVVSDLDEDATVERLRQGLPDSATVVSFDSAAVLAGALDGRADIQVLVVSRGRRSSMDDLDEEPGRVVEVPLVGLAAAMEVADLVVLQATAASAAGFVATRGSLTVAAVAAQFDTPVWMAAPLGTYLPARLFERLVAGLRLERGWEQPFEVVPAELVSSVAGPRGVQPVGEAAGRMEAPLAPELLR